MPHWVKRAADWVWDRLDPLVALLLAAILSVLDWLDKVETEQLAAPTLFVLAVLSFTLIRERTARTDLRSVLTGLIRQDKGAWEIRRTEVTWDLLTDDGMQATARKRRRVRFLHDDVFAMHDRSHGSGAVSNYTSSDPSQYDKVDEFSAGGETFYLISLKGFRRAGQELDVEMTRTLAGTFTKPRESVTVDVATGAEIIMTVIWPSSRPPTSLWLERGGKFDKDIPLTELRNTGGRSQLTKEFTDPEPGTPLTIGWAW